MQNLPEPLVGTCARAVRAEIREFKFHERPTALSLIGALKTAQNGNVAPTAGGRTASTRRTASGFYKIFGPTPTIVNHTGAEQLLGLYWQKQGEVLLDAVRWRQKNRRPEGAR